MNIAYNMDCMEAMRQMPDKCFDLAVVDPPYFSGPERRGYYMIAQIEAKYNRLFHLKMDMLMQMVQDAAMIAAHDVLHLGSGRARDFCEAYITAMNDMARMVVDDQKDDKEFVYAKEKIDEQIKSIVGSENFQPWEVRYGNIQK